MNELDLTCILRNGNFYNLAIEKNNYADVVNKLGQYDERVDNDNFSYDLYWGDVCISFYKSDNSIFYIQILLSKGKAYGKYKISDYYDEIKFHSRMEIESFLLFLNHSEIPYTITNSPSMNVDLLIVKISELEIFYHLEDKLFLKIHIGAR